MEFLGDVVEDANDTRGLSVAFDTKVVRKDTAEGPVFKEVDYIRIAIPGDRSTEIHRPVEDDDKRRFAARWKHYEATKTNPVNGQPLTEWPAISRAEVETCHYHGVRSIEELAALTEERARGLGHGFLALSVRAQDFLRKSKDEGYMATMRKELDEARGREQVMASQLEEMKQALAELKKGNAEVKPAKRG
jgi:hypothetical protein